MSRLLTLLRSKGGVTYGAEAQSVFAAFDTAPTLTRKAQIDAAVAHLLAAPLSGANVWSKLDTLQVYKAADQQAALVDWKAPSARTALAINSPTFTADYGFGFNGSNNEVDTQFNPGDGVAHNFLRDDASFGIWQVAHPGTPVGSIAGWFDGSDGITLQLWNGAAVSGAFGYRLNQATATNDAATSGVGVGIATRSGASATSFSRDGARTHTHSIASTTLNDATLRVGRVTTTSYTAGDVSATFAGGALTEDEEVDVLNALLGYSSGVDAGEVYRITADIKHAVRNAYDSTGRHYVIVGSNELHISEDGGATYTLRYTFPDSPGRVYGFFITSDDTLLVSGDGQTTGVSGRTYRSTDQGQTFTQITSFDASFNSGNIHFWSATQDASGSIFVGQYNIVPTRVQECNVWKSTDDGVTWTNIADASWSTNDHVHGVGIDAATGWLYATIGDTTGGVWRSKLKDGTDWVRKVGTTAGDAEYLFIPLEFDGTYVYFGDDQQEGAIRRFADDGTGDVQATATVLDDADKHNVYYLKRDPTGRFWCCMPPADAVWGEEKGKIYVSDDGEAWTLIYQATPMPYATWVNGASSQWTLHTGTTQWGNQLGGTNLFPLNDSNGLLVTIT